MWVAFFVGTLLVCKLHVTKVPAYIMFGMYTLYILYQFIAAFTSTDDKASPITICFSSLNICI